MRLSLTLAGTALIAVAAPAVFAQEQGGTEKVNALIIYGDDKCPESTGEEITICARKEEKERYRIPQGLRETPSATSESWNSRVLAYERMGKTGTLSCTPTGPGGWTGCSQKLIDQAYAEKNGGEDVQFGKLIDAERAKRLGDVDANAAATQARVEEAEKRYEARQRAEQDPQGQPAPEPSASPTPKGN